MLKLKSVRLEKGFSVPALSKESGVPVRTIEDIEKRGDSKVSNAAKLANALGVTLNDLWDESEEA